MSAYIAIEGLIGAGKTTLARAVARSTSATLLLEQPASNPFLEPYYRAPERYVLPCQLAYLMHRHDQLSELTLGDHGAVADYVYEKDTLHAHWLLTGAELNLYERIAETLASRIRPPDLLVWLDVSPETCLARIAKRGAPGEESITLAYLAELQSRYDDLLARWDHCPVLRLDGERDVGAEPTVLEQWVSQIGARVKLSRS